MIGVDRFSSVFGGSPAHTESHYVEHLRAVIRAGYSPVLCKPGTAELACILTPTQQKRVGTHECGYGHVLNDPLKVGAVVKNWLKTYGGLNVGLHLGRSKMAVIKAAASPGMTVEIGNYVAGHWWFDIPEGAHLADSWTIPNWQLFSGEDHVLVPPSMLHRSAYRLVGGTIPAPEWMLQ